jgi:hypothetical protein
MAILHVKGGRYGGRSPPPAPQIVDILAYPAQLIRGIRRNRHSAMRRARCRTEAWRRRCRDANRLDDARAGSRRPQGTGKNLTPSS